LQFPAISRFSHQFVGNVNFKARVNSSYSTFVKPYHRFRPLTWLIVQVKWKGYKNRHFRRTSRCISQTIQHMATITMEDAIYNDLERP